MLNDRVDTSSEFLSEGMLNGGLILVNFVVPLAVVAREVLQYQQRKSKGGSPHDRAGWSQHSNPVLFEDEESQPEADATPTEMEFGNPVTSDRDPSNLALS